MFKCRRYMCIKLHSFVEFYNISFILYENINEGFMIILYSDFIDENNSLFINIFLLIRNKNAFKKLSNVSRRVFKKQNYKRNLSIRLGLFRVFWYCQYNIFFKLHLLMKPMIKQIK